MSRAGSGREDSGPSFELRVIGALVIREIYTRFGRENIGFAWVVMEPTLFCLGVILLWSFAVAKDHHVQIPLLEFLLTGYMPLMMYRHSVNRLLRCMQANGDLLYHRSVTVFRMYVARLVVEIVGTLAAFAIVTALFVIWGLAKPPVDMSMILAGLGVYTLFTVGVAICIGALSERSEVVEKIWSPLSYITIPLSGTFYMLYWLPPGARDILVYIPMTTGVEMIRSGYFGPGVPTFYEWEASVAISAVFLAVGLLLLRGAQRHIEIG